MRSLLMVAVALLALPAAALALDDPDTEVARKHFENGRAAYDANNYETALHEFEAAKRAKRSPLLDYNIARCYDRLENYPKAVEHYQLYVSAMPGASDAGETRERIAQLKVRIAEMEAHPEKPREVDKPNDSQLLKPPSLDLTVHEVPRDRDREQRESRRRTLAIVLGTVAGCVVIAGAIVLGVLLSGSSVDYTPSSLGLVKSTL